jgi:ATP-dependent Clp protease adaptor protein ClpS
MLTFGTAMIALLAIVLLVGVFYVLATGRLRFTWQWSTDAEGDHSAPDWEGQRLPVCRVILHNDDHTPMPRVVRALRKVIPRLTLGRAVSIMYEAHDKGRAVVTESPRETAERYREGLTAEGLTSTIEPER